MNRKLLAAPVLALVLAACGGHAASGATSGTDVLTKVGCSTAPHDEGYTLFATSAKSCTTDAGDVTVYTFANTQNRDHFLTTAQSVGGAYVVGPSWIVAADTSDAATKLQARTGGIVH